MLTNKQIRAANPWKMPADVGVQSGGGDQVVTGEENRQRRREAAGGEMQTESSCRWSSGFNSSTAPEWAITWREVDLETTFLSKAMESAKWTQTDTLLLSKDSTSTLMTPKCQLKGLKRDKHAVRHDNHHIERTTDIFPLLGIFLFQSDRRWSPDNGTNTIFGYFHQNAQDKKIPCFQLQGNGANRMKMRVGRTQGSIQEASE